MTEPTAEHLKAAQEWLEKRGGSLEGPLASQSYGWVEVSDENVSALAALLASREQALREENERHKAQAAADREGTKRYADKWRAAEARVRERDETIRAQDLHRQDLEARLKRVVEAMGRVRYVHSEKCLQCQNADAPDQFCEADRVAAAALAAAQSSEEPKRLLGHAFVGIDASACAALVLPSGLRCGRPASEHERQ